MKKSHWSNNALPILILGCAVFLALKYWYINADNDAVRFLTSPTNAMISIVNQSLWTYTSEHGFAHQNLNIIIDKSCSGFNFFLLSASLFLFTLAPHFKSTTIKLLSIPLSYFMGYFFTVAVNTSRILVSMKLDDILPLKYSWLHEAQGAFIYLSLLITAYLILNFIIKKYTTPHNESIA